jgi:hypothetical protein
MTQKCDKGKEITEFIEKCRFGDKLYENGRNEANDKAFSGDEYKIKIYRMFGR